MFFPLAYQLLPHAQDAAVNGSRVDFTLGTAFFGSGIGNAGGS